MDRYADCLNGTVTDSVTGLIWLQNADCFGPLDWATGNEAAARLENGVCGLADGSAPGDWRLPTQAEWEATIAPFCRNPALTDLGGWDCFESGVQPFFGVFLGRYWSGSSLADTPDRARAVELGVGSIIELPKDFPGGLLVWPVRGGP
jgi:hypothetical protein